MSRPGTDRLKFNPPLGTLPALQYLLPAQLSIDPSYQRSLESDASQTLVRAIAQHWNWDLCQPLVVARRDDGALYVIDGQHRLAAARLRGDIAQLPAVVVQYASAQDEAASFVLLNQQRKPLSRIDLFKAAVASGDRTANAILAAMEHAGLSVAPHTNFTAWKPGMVSNIGGIEAAWRSYGGEVTAQALDLMATAFADQVLRYAGTIFPGIAALVDLEARQGGTVKPIGDEIRDLLIDVISGQSQEEWRAAIMQVRAHHPDLNFARASAKTMLEAWQEALGEWMDEAEGASAPEEEPEAAAEPEPEPEPDPEPAPATAQPSTASKGPKSIGPIDWGKVASGKANIETFKPDADGKCWCTQHDRRVTRAEVRACKDKHCSFGGVA